MLIYPVDSNKRCERQNEPSIFVFNYNVKINKFSLTTK